MKVTYEQLIEIKHKRDYSFTELTNFITGEDILMDKEEFEKIYKDPEEKSCFFKIKGTNIIVIPASFNRLKVTQLTEQKIIEMESCQKYKRRLKRDARLQKENELDEKIIRKCEKYLAEWKEKEDDIQYIMKNRPQVIITKNDFEGKKITHNECLKIITVEDYISRIHRAVYHRTSVDELTNSKDDIKYLCYKFINF